MLNSILEKNLSPTPMNQFLAVIKPELQKWPMLCGPVEHKDMSKADQSQPIVYTVALTRSGTWNCHPKIPEALESSQLPTVVSSRITVRRNRLLIVNA